MKFRFLLFCLSVLAVFSFAETAPAQGVPTPAPTSNATSGEIVLTIQGFRNEAGVARVALFNSPDGFPNHRGEAVRTAVAKISGGQAVVSFKDIPYGEYALGVIHDENGNDALDMSPSGMPREGVGASNNAAGMFGVPKYQKAVFHLEAPKWEQTVTIVYF